MSNPADGNKPARSNSVHRHAYLYNRHQQDGPRVAVRFSRFKGGLGWEVFVRDRGDEPDKTPEEQELLDGQVLLRALELAQACEVYVKGKPRSSGPDAADGPEASKERRAQGYFRHLQNELREAKKARPKT